MMLYSIMTCSSPPHTWGSGLMSGCSIAWLSLALLLLIILMIRRQTDDGILAGTPFFFPGALVGGMGIALILITLFGEARWGLLGGLGGMILGGFGLEFIGLGGGSE